MKKYFWARGVLAFPIINICPGCFLSTGFLSWRLLCCALMLPQAVCEFAIPAVIASHP